MVSNNSIKKRIIIFKIIVNVFINTYLLKNINLIRKIYFEFKNQKVIKNPNKKKPILTKFNYFLNFNGNKLLKSFIISIIFTI